ncbi:MAG: hypothetical protein JO162_10610, partial [Alphaproteobacteria bacterium]|nr:hypothetical protein [Alphaproteobacteria bacterium]
MQNGVPMGVKEAIALPNLEATANTRHVYFMAVFDGSFIAPNVKMHDIYDVTFLTDEVYVIQGHVSSSEIGSPQ